MIIGKNTALTAQTGLIKRNLKEDTKSEDTFTPGNYKPDEDFLNGDKIKSLNGNRVKETEEKQHTQRKSGIGDNPVAKTALASIVGIAIGCIINVMKK